MFRADSCTRRAGAERDPEGAVATRPSSSARRSAAPRCAARAPRWRGRTGKLLSADRSAPSIRRRRPAHRSPLSMPSRSGRASGASVPASSRSDRAATWLPCSVAARGCGFTPSKPPAGRRKPATKITVATATAPTLRPTEGWHRAVEETRPARLCRRQGRSMTPSSPGSTLPSRKAISPPACRPGWCHRSLRPTAQRRQGLCRGHQSGRRRSVCQPRLGRRARGSPADRCAARPLRPGVHTVFIDRASPRSIAPALPSRVRRRVRQTRRTAISCPPAGFRSSCASRRCRRACAARLL
jgi:hypothetical protein